MYVFLVVWTVQHIGVVYVTQPMHNGLFVCLHMWVFSKFLLDLQADAEAHLTSAHKLKTFHLRIRLGILLNTKTTREPFVLRLHTGRTMPGSINYHSRVSRWQLLSAFCESAAVTHQSRLGHSGQTLHTCLQNKRTQGLLGAGGCTPQLTWHKAVSVWTSTSAEIWRHQQVFYSADSWQDKRKGRNSWWWQMRVGENGLDFDWIPPWVLPKFILQQWLKSRYGLSRSQPQTLLSGYTFMAKSIYRHAIVAGLL